MAQAAVMAALCAATSILSALIPVIAGCRCWGLSRWGCSRTATGSARSLRHSGGMRDRVRGGGDGGGTSWAALHRRHHRVVKRRGRGCNRASRVAGGGMWPVSRRWQPDGAVQVAGARVRLDAGQHRRRRGGDDPRPRLARPCGLDQTDFRSVASLLAVDRRRRVGRGCSRATVVEVVGLSRVLRRLDEIPTCTSCIPSESDRSHPSRCSCARSRSATPGWTTTPSSVDSGRQSRQHVAVTGANGAGKTTLMLILAGRRPPRERWNVPVQSGLATSVEPR